MSLSRKVKLLAMTKNIKLMQYRREAAKLFAEIDRLTKRIEQLDSLQQGYRDHLSFPDMSPSEYRGVMQISGLLVERRSVDLSRRDLLEGERSRLTSMLVAKQREIEKLEEEGSRLATLERNERQDRQDALMPARRHS